MTSTPSRLRSAHHITPTPPPCERGAHGKHAALAPPAGKHAGRDERECSRGARQRSREGGEQPQQSKRFCGSSLSAGTAGAAVRVDRTGFSVSPATGLSGLRESRFLSTFLECYTGMYPLVDNASIREGLLHQFVKLSKARHTPQSASLSPQQQYQQRPQQQQQPPQQQRQQQNGAASLLPLPPPPPDTAASNFEAMRGQALSCALFSCMAIGALVEGSPLASVEIYTAAARRCLPEFEGLADRSAVSALVLYAIASEFFAGRGAGTGYRVGMNAAKAVFEGLPGKKKDPVLSAILAHLTVLEGFPLLKFVESSCSVNPANHGVGGGGGGSGGGGNSKIKRKSSGSSVGKRDRGSNQGNESNISSSSSVDSNHTGDSSNNGKTSISYMSADTATEELKLQRAVASREPVSVAPGQPAPPVYVVADALLLGIRFSRDRGDITTRLWHLHDFASTELDRFRSTGVGAVALLALCGSLLGVQIRLGALGDGMLATARLSSALVRECPGLVRIYHCHVVHLSMAAFRLHGCRQEYEGLRRLMATTIGRELPAFDDLVPEKSLCSMHVCNLHAKTLLAMPMTKETTAAGEAPSSGSSSSGGDGAGDGSCSGSGSGDCQPQISPIVADTADPSAAASPAAGAAPSIGVDTDTAAAGGTASTTSADARASDVKKEDPLLEEGAKLLSGLR